MLFLILMVAHNHSASMLMMNNHNHSSIIFTSKLTADSLSLLRSPPYSSRSHETYARSDNHLTSTTVILSQPESSSCQLPSCPCYVIQIWSGMKTLIDATNFLAMKESQTLAFLISRHSFSDFLESMECRLTSISIEFFLPQTSSVLVSFFLIASPAIFSVLLFFFIPLSFFASQAFPAP